MPLRPNIFTVQGRFFSVILLSLFLGGCGEESKPSQTSQAPVPNEDTGLPEDLGRAGSELERRLLKSVSVQDGVMLVRDPVMGRFVSYVLPVSSPWVISCGIGLSVTFGISISGDESSVGNEVVIHLARVLVDQETCGVLAPQLGRRLKVLLQEQGSQ
jgi:hypothetical protein